jgi:signal transduction histidine kinase
MEPNNIVSDLSDATSVDNDNDSPPELSSQQLWELLESGEINDAYETNRKVVALTQELKNTAAKLHSARTSLAESNRNLSETNEMLFSLVEQLAIANEKLAIFNDKLLKANEKISNNERMEKEFVNIAAHELRTPIQPILGVIDILKDHMAKKSSGEITKNQLAIIERNAKRLQRLSSEILDATRIESGTLKLEKEMLDIHEKIRNVIADAENTILRGQRRGPKLVFEPEVDARTRKPIPIFVMADRLRIFEVISNLIRNAIKFSSTANDGPITITTQRERGKDYNAKTHGGGDNDNGNDDSHSSGSEDHYMIVVVSIMDQGPGISEDILPRLFKRFSADRERGDVGLGLFIAKNIVEAHGGKIWAENSKDGKGATFRFTLPVEES